MKYALGFLILCFSMSNCVAKVKPLCEIKKMITNETFYTQALFALVHGERKPLQCIAGCVLYTIDSTLGDLIKRFVGMPYNFFQRCITRGIRERDTCKIVDCLVGSVQEGLHLLETLGVHLPFENLIKGLPVFSNYYHYGPAPVQEEPEVETTPPPPPPVLTTSVAPAPAPAPAPKAQEHSAAHPLATFQPKEKPLCRILDVTQNVTALVNIFGSAFFGDRQPLNCFIGCVMYSLDRYIGECAKKVFGPVYSLYGNCVNAGVEESDTCQITDCIMNFIVMGDRIINDFHLPIPFLNAIEKLPIFQSYNDHNPDREPPSVATTTTTTTTTTEPPHSTGNILVPTLTVLSVSTVISFRFVFLK